MLTIRQCTISQLEESPSFKSLLDEYAEESSIVGMPKHNAKMDMYRGLEAAGVIASFAAYVLDELVGFVVVLSPVLPHYGVTVSTTESYFVAKAHRSSGAGMELLRCAESHAKAIGSPGLLVSAPVGGALERVLPRAGYVQTNSVFFRGFGHE
jgi:GNAT superfamily N-acetyltransferase